jgi:hypothetical protein
MTNFVFDEPVDFYNYINEDKSKYKTATEAGYHDPDNDFLIGNSGGFLMNISFTFTDTYILNEAARNYERYGTYIDEVFDSPLHIKFRKQEEERRRNGFVAPCKKNRDGSVSYLRITGDHYNFINYGRMLRLDTKSVKSSANTGKKIPGFPSFIDAQYWWFKIKEFATNNGFNEIVCKTRRGGFSYSEAIDTANEINLNKELTVILAASDTKYLTEGNAIASMAQNQIVFYETSTPFKRGIIKNTPKELKLGYKDANALDRGIKSRYLCVSTFNNPGAAVGKDGVKIKAEELGKFDNFDEFCTETMPTLRTGAYVTGKLTGFGTINKDNTSAGVFSENFYNPAKWHFMPFENVWDKNARHTVCGYYKPFWWGLEGQLNGRHAMDKDGNTDYNVSIAIVKKEQENEWLNAKNLSDYGDYIGQYGNRPEDSFGASFNNIFTSEGLLNHRDKIKNSKDLVNFRDGVYYPSYDTKGKIKSVDFLTNVELYNDGRKEEIHPFISALTPGLNKDNHGCVREYSPPIKVPKIVEGAGIIRTTPDGLYRIWVDPFGVDKNKDTITDDNSFGVAIVYMNHTNINGEKGDRIVAIYVGRPEKQEEFSRILLYLSYRYNAMVFTENDRGQVVQDFKHWKEVKRLVVEPSLAWDANLAGSDGREFGISMGQGHSNRRLVGIGYWKEWLYTIRGKDEDDRYIYNYHTINDIGILDEICAFNFKGNFDRLSACIVGAYDVKEMTYNLKNYIDNNNVKGHSKKDSVFNRSWFVNN